MRSRLIALSFLALAGCHKGVGSRSVANGVDAAAVVATAAVIGTIQAARAQNPDHRDKDGACRFYCDPCEVPCGDDCLPYGAFCFEPPGRACGEIVRPDVPVPKTPRICPVAPGIYVDTTS